jgi:hypothetical protein
MFIAASCVVDELEAGREPGLEVSALVRVQRRALVDDVLVSGQEEPAGAAGGVHNGVSWRRIHDLDHGADE